SCTSKLTAFRYSAIHDRASAFICNIMLFFSCSSFHSIPFH
ncbi:hypothetical protein M153_11570003260, partial [Pseudoloma neurophilia]